MSPISRRTHARSAALQFAALGAQVGAFAVLVPDLAASRGLSTAALGAAVAVVSASNIAMLFAAGPLADRHGRRPLLVAGTTGFAAAFALLAAVEASAALWPTLALYGVAGGCLDLGANAVGSDYERAHGVRAMVRLHAAFSGSAAAFALIAAVLDTAAGHRIAYAAMAAGYAAVLAATAKRPLPPHRRTEREHAGRRAELLRIPAIALAAAICTLCFFGDGAIESFSALLLRGVQGAGTVGTGLSLAAFHAASLTGRLTFARVAEARGERFVLTFGGLLASAATALLVATTQPAVATLALIVIGLALAPVIPTLLSIAGRSAPGRSAAAVSLVTTIGYSAFVAGPPAVGALAGATSLRAGFGLVIASTAAFALLSRRLPQ